MTDLFYPDPDALRLIRWAQDPQAVAEGRCAPLPCRAHPDDAGFDLAAGERAHVRRGGAVVRVRTGWRVEIPTGWMGLIRERSGVAAAGLYTLGGVIDAGYRGEIVILCGNHGPQQTYHIEPGQRIAQLLIIPCPARGVQSVEVPAEALSPTSRDGGGFGSSGR